MTDRFASLSRLFDGSTDCFLNVNEDLAVKSGLLDGTTLFSFKRIDDNKALVQAFKLIPHSEVQEAKATRFVSNAKDYCATDFHDGTVWFTAKMHADKTVTVDALVSYMDDYRDDYFIYGREVTFAQTVTGTSIIHIPGL